MRRVYAGVVHATASHLSREYVPLLAAQLAGVGAEDLLGYLRIVKTLFSTEVAIGLTLGFPMENTSTYREKMCP